MLEYWNEAVVPFFVNFGSTAARISQGLDVTLELFFATLILSIPLGLIISLGAISHRKWIKSPIKTYIWLLRGTPLMLQLLFVYYGLYMLFGIVLDAMPAALLAFVLNYAAYFAEIFRGGIQSIDNGQFEAAYAMGFSKMQTMWRIILPQTIGRILPPVGNEAISLVKDTSLVSIISLSDILTRTKNIVAAGTNISAFFVAAVFYLVMTFVITKIFDMLEKRFSAGIQRI